ncbi:MAG: glutamate racemase [Parerythrobacter sp.]
MEESSPILLFDSGVGGLTVLAALRATLPDAPVIYAADMVGLPYGEKSEAEIAARVAGLLGRMSERYRPRLACIACNTASTIALDMVRDVLEIPVVGTVPAIKPATAQTVTGVIGLLGTQATVRQGYVDRLSAQFAADKVLLRQGAGALVDEAEAKLRGTPPDRATIEAAVTALVGQPRGTDIDTVVLACTHFPLLREELHAAFCDAVGRDVALVDGAHGIARRIADLTQHQPIQRSHADLAITTGSLADFRTLAPALSRYGLDRLERF